MFDVIIVKAPTPRKQVMLISRMITDVVVKIMIKEDFILDNLCLGGRSHGLVEENNGVW